MVILLKTLLAVLHLPVLKTRLIQALAFKTQLILLIQSELAKREKAKSTA
jgi:hypothetical protein